MLLHVCREFIQSGFEKNQLQDNCQLLAALVLIKQMTLIDEINAELLKIDRKRVNGFTLPYTASYNYIIKHINSPKLYEIIDNAFIKIEKSNPQLKENLVLRKEIINLDFKVDGTLEKIKVIKKIEELDLNPDLFIRLLNEINMLKDEEEFKLVNDFLKYDIYDLYEEYEINRIKAFEDKRMTTFKGDIPISVNNSIIYDRTFIVEQWIRRIIMFVLMTEYGPNWITAFEDEDLEEYESMRRKLSGREVLDFKDDHLLWYATIAYLGEFIKRKDMAEKIEKITDTKAQIISKAVFKVADIRNEMAHNRTITKVMEEDYNENFIILKDAIMNFKKKTLYSNDGEIVSDMGTEFDQHSDFIVYFNKAEQEQFNAFGTQSFIEEEKYYYSIILLPCRAIGGNYIDIQVVLERFDIFKDYIVAFYVNKQGGEYQIIVSKKIETEKMVYRSIINTFFEIVKTIGTDHPYEFQDPKYTCNPKIWFYENSTEYALNNGLW